MNENKYEINREIVFSTAHISEGCNEALCNASEGIYESDESPLTQLSVYEDEYGVRIHIFGTDKFPPTGFLELDHLLKVALDNDCQWLRFDRDGLVYDGFETFDW